MTETANKLGPREQSLLEKASRLMLDCIDCEYTVRTAKTVTVKGVITACEFGYFKYTTSAMKVVFKITMKCGLNETLREFHVTTLPRK